MAGALILCLLIAITDGDILKARGGEARAYEQVTVRLAEIHAPEKTQPFGNRSKLHLGMLCFVALATITPQTRDGHGRTVTRVECRGKDANAGQVRNSMAWAYTKYLTDSAIGELQEDAQAGVRACGHIGSRSRLGRGGRQSGVEP